MTKVKRIMRIINASAYWGLFHVKPIIIANRGYMAGDGRGAIVNPANSHGLMGGGAAFAIKGFDEELYKTLRSS